MLEVAFPPAILLEVVHVEKRDSHLRDRAAYAMAEADRLTDHLDPTSDECVREWIRIFHEVLYDRVGLKLVQNV